METTELTTKLYDSLRDATYVAVGLGVIGFQRAQVLRHDLTKAAAEDRAKREEQLRSSVDEVRVQVEAQVAEVRTQLAKAYAEVEDVLEPVAKELDTRLDEVEARLPEQVKVVVQQARAAAEQATTSLRTLLVPAA